MNRRGAGIGLVGISAFLLSTKWILDFAIDAGWYREFDMGLLQDMNSLFGLFSGAALVAGVVYVVIAEIHKEK